MFSTTCIQRHNHDNSGFIKRHQIVHYQGHHILYQHQVTWNIFNNVGFSNTCKSTHKLCWKFSMVQWVVMGSAMGSLGLAHAPCVVQTLVVWFSMIWCVAHCEVLRRQIFLQECIWEYWNALAEWNVSAMQVYTAVVRQNVHFCD